MTACDLDYLRKRATLGVEDCAQIFYVGARPAQEAKGRR
jgi:hypothetical protein